MTFTTVTKNLISQDGRKTRRRDQRRYIFSKMGKRDMEMHKQHSKRRRSGRKTRFKGNQFTKQNVEQIASPEGSQQNNEVDGEQQQQHEEEEAVLLHKTVPAVILNVRIETKSRDYKINTK